MRNDHNKIEIKLEKDDSSISRQSIKNTNKKKSDEGISSLASSSESDISAKKVKVSVDYGLSKFLN
jgi:hypothetical protein